MRAYAARGTSQTRRVVSREADTSSSSDCAQHTPQTLCSCPRSVRMHPYDFSKSQSLTLMSAEQDASTVPLALKQASLTVDVCPFNVRSNDPDSQSQTLSVPSSEAETNKE